MIFDIATASGYHCQRPITLDPPAPPAVATWHHLCRSHMCTCDCIPAHRLSQLNVATLRQAFRSESAQTRSFFVVFFCLQRIFGQTAEAYAVSTISGGMCLAFALFIVQTDMVFFLPSCFQGKVRYRFYLQGLLNSQLDFITGIGALVVVCGVIRIKPLFGQRKS
jgi:hypothetical protein